MLSREECSPAKGKFICPSLIISQIATKTSWKIMPSSMNAHVLIFVLGARLTLYVEFFHRSKENKDEDCLQNHSYRYQPNSIRRNELAPLTITLWISMHFSTILYSLRPSSFFMRYLLYPFFVEKLPPVRIYCRGMEMIPTKAEIRTRMFVI